MKKKLTVILFFIFCFLAPALAKLSDSEKRALFDQANQAFRAANEETNSSKQTELYQTAILQYERLINEGQIENAKLYYNLANAYQLNDQLGKAILNYRRAEQLDQRDANIQKNLSFARSRRLDRVSLQAEQRVRQTLFFWHYDFSLNVRVILASLGFGGICLALTCMLWRGRKSLSSVVIVVSAILFTANAASVIVEQVTQTGRAYGVITAEQTIARQGDGQSYAESFKDPLHEGTEFELLEHRSGWYHIRLVDSSEGWIPEDTAEVI